MLCRKKAESLWYLNTIMCMIDLFCLNPKNTTCRLQTLLEGVRRPYIGVRNAVTIGNVAIFLGLNSGAH